MALIPKRTKYRRPHRLRYDGVAKGNTKVNFGEYGLMAMEGAWIRQNQIDGLLEASKHNLVAGLLLNFRNDNNDTFFVLIDDFFDMMNSINKKSFNIKDLESIGATRIDSEKKRTRYRYDISKMIGELHI